MDKVFITAIICTTITALAWMIYDLRRRRIAAADRKAKTRTIEKEVVVEVPVFAHGSSAAPATEEKKAQRRKGKGSIKGYYVGQDGSVQTIAEGSGGNGAAAE